MVDGFVEHVNAGDVDAARALFAETATFDSVGRNYADRDEIFDRFLIPESSTQVTATNCSTSTPATTADSDFATDSGLTEHFTYD